MKHHRQSRQPQGGNQASQQQPSQPESSPVDSVDSAMQQSQPPSETQKGASIAPSSPSSEKAEPICGLRPQMLDQEHLDPREREIERLTQEFITDNAGLAESALSAIARRRGMDIRTAFYSYIWNRLNPPKFVNPCNPLDTWVGRGHKPGWVRDHLETGGILRDLLNPNHPDYDNLLEEFSVPETAQ